MFGEIIGAISNFMYSYLLIIMLIGVGLYYTLRTRLVQVRMFKETIRVILEKPVESGAVSSFQALMVSTASRVGTGNIRHFHSYLPRRLWCCVLDVGYCCCWRRFCFY